MTTVEHVPTLLTTHNLDRQAIQSRLDAEGVALLPPMDARDSLRLVEHLGLRFQATILDPWYNKGFGGVQKDYDEFILELLSLSGGVSEHVFLWGFPEIIARFVDRIPPSLHLVAWLTWYYKNSPSVIRGWRSSQNACLHLSQAGAKLFPEHFMNAAQRERHEQGTLRYMPGPTSVIEESLLVGFVGRKEQTGHPAQKPVTLFEKLILMTTKEGDLVFDPLSGSGTTGEAVRRTKRLAILCDCSEEYTALMEERLQITRAGAISDGVARSSRRAKKATYPAIPGGLFDGVVSEGRPAIRSRPRHTRRH